MSNEGKTQIQIDAEKAHKMYPDHAPKPTAPEETTPKPEETPPPEANPEDKKPEDKKPEVEPKPAPDKPSDQPPPEEKPEDKKPDDKTEEKPENTKKPEDEDYSLVKAKDGQIVESDVVEAIVSDAKKQGISPKGAQLLVDAYEKRITDFARKQTQTISDVRQGWDSASRSDKEIGGDKYDQTVGLSNKALDRFASEGFKKLAKESGLEKNPEFLRVFSKIGQAMSSDKHPGGHLSGTKQPMRAADKLYGGTK